MQYPGQGMPAPGKGAVGIQPFDRIFLSATSGSRAAGILHVLNVKEVLLVDLLLAEVAVATPPIGACFLAIQASRAAYVELAMKRSRCRHHS